MKNLKTRMGRASCFAVLAALPLLAAADTAGNGTAAVSPVLAEYGFESIPAYIPHWGAGYGSTYRPATGWKEPFVVSLDREDPHSGLAAMSVRFTAGNESVIRVHSPAIAIPEPLRGKSISVECYVKGVGIDPQKVGLGVMEKDAEGKTIGYLSHNPALAPVTAGADWEKLSFKGKLNSRTASVLLMFTAVEGMPDAQLWVDDIIILSVD